MLLSVIPISALLLVVVGGSSTSFKDKTNKDLHCKLGNKEKFTELSITPGKHIYNDAAGIE
jgi:molybdopterin biosynthesis enzyme